MTILFIEVNKIKKCGLFSWEKPKYETLFMSYKEYATEEEAIKRLDSIDDWFYDPYNGVHRSWVDTMYKKFGKWRKSKTCYLGDMAYTAFIV